MNEIFKNCLGVISSPGQTIGKLMENKRWQAVLAIILLASAILTYLAYPVTRVEQAKLIRDSEMAGKLSDEQLANLDQFTPGQRLFGALTKLPLSALMILMAAFFVYLFYKVVGAEGNFSHYFTAVVYASLLDMFLGGILKTTLVLFKKTIFVHTGLTMLAPGLDFRSITFIALSQFDFFSIWYLAALALGIACFTKIRPQKSFFVIAMYFLFKSLVFVSFSYFSIKLFGF